MSAVLRTDDLLGTRTYLEGESGTLATEKASHKRLAGGGNSIMWLVKIKTSIYSYNLGLFHSQTVAESYAQKLRQGTDRPTVLIEELTVMQ